MNDTSRSRDVWRIGRSGSLDRLRRERDVLPAPGPGEARVRVEAIGLNFADIFACLGLYSATPKGPFVPGLEFAGSVVEVGRSADPSAAPPTGLSSGDRVFGVARFGAYATALNVPLGQLVPVPNDWGAASAAAFPVQALTAYYGLIELAHVARDEVVLLHSAAGGVGLSALPILRTVGARVVATVGSESKRRFLVDRRGLRADHVIVRDRQRFAAQLAAALTSANADGFDVIFDAVAGPFFKPAFDRLRPRGRYVTYGAADFMPRGARAASPRLLVRYLRRPRIDPLALIDRNRSVMGFNLIWLWDQVNRLAETCRAILTMSPEPPLVGRQFTFDDLPAALRFLQSGASVGKVIVTTGA